MKKLRSSDNQILLILKQGESGAPYLIYAMSTK